MSLRKESIQSGKVVKSKKAYTRKGRAKQQDIKH
jgi:hypothetical protein